MRFVPHGQLDKLLQVFASQIGSSHSINLLSGWNVTSIVEAEAPYSLKYEYSLNPLVAEMVDRQMVSQSSSVGIPCTATGTDAIVEPSPRAGDHAAADHSCGFAYTCALMFRRPAVFDEVSEAAFVVTVSRRSSTCVMAQP